MYKKGDQVRCIKSMFGNETVGKIYTVHSYTPGVGMGLWIEKDDRGNINSYDENQFELVKTVGLPQAGAIGSTCVYTVPTSGPATVHLPPGMVISVHTPKKKSCECGKEKHGFASHSDWCDLWVKN